MPNLKLRPPKWIYLLFLIGAAALAMRGLLASPYGSTAVFYLAVPFTISFLIYHFVDPPTEATRMARFGTHVRNTTIVLFASSALLQEGFLCVLFIMPIYYLVVVLDFAFISWAEARRKRGGSHFSALVLPLLVAVLSLEGVSQATTLERAGQVTYQATLPASIAELKDNMAQPKFFDAPRAWLIAFFPAPSRVEAGSLAEGDIHRLTFFYRKWFVTEALEGELLLRIDAVGPDHLRTSVVGNDSYLASYMTIKGTEVRMKTLKSGGTRVTLTLFYDRKLDPSWYFGPLQALAMTQSAKYLMESVIARQATDGEVLDG